MKQNIIFIMSGICVLFISSFSTAQDNAQTVNMSISSSSFSQHGYIPSKFTCDGLNINPALKVKNIPEGAKTLALIVDDPDAPGRVWVHWVVWNIDAGKTEIRENSVPGGGVQGMNDFGNHEYGGPCPPSGTHRYFFKVYALDKKLELGPGSNKADVEKAMRGHVLADSSIIGLYKRK